MKVLIQGVQTELLIGMDAEFFVKQGDRYIAAARVIPGLKHQPHKLDNGVCHPDGLSLEVGAPPADTPEGMITNLFTVLQEVQDKYLTPQGCTIAYTEEVQHKKVYGVQPEDLQFGCGVEFDANHERRDNNTNMVKTVLTSQQDRRFSGFHIHLGFTKDQEVSLFTYKDMARLVLKLDELFRGVGLQTSERRATQYGGFGAFRVKPYGIEYRMMDCTVITDKSKLQLLLQQLNKLPQVFKELSC